MLLTADATTEDAEEGEEGELNDAPESSSDAVKAEEDEGAMDIDKSTADQGKRVQIRLSPQGLCTLPCLALPRLALPCLPLVHGTTVFLHETVNTA